MRSDRLLVLAGNPNSGKTTLFNTLTGSCQRVGNWPGVTVEKKQGQFTLGDESFDVIDLPGAYTLSGNHLDGLDEQIAANYISEMQQGTIVNVVDATNLERHLYLTVQLIERRLPMIVVLTMVDKLPKDALNLPLLSELLGVPVVPVASHKSQGVTAFTQALQTETKLPTHKRIVNYPRSVQQTLQTSATRSAEVDTFELLRRTQSEDQELEILIADARYGCVNQLCQKVKKAASVNTSKASYRIDKLLLNRFLGIPCFLFIMYSMFLFAINIGGAFQDCFDQLSETIFVNGTASLLNSLHFPAYIIAILAHGLGKGINTVVTFIPVIAAMYFFLAFLEGTGYMARAAFVVDRMMRKIGLPGKAFVPLIVGFGCNVPSIMATRTLDNHKDRILAALMSPFMSCSARLAIFTVFVSVFFPSGGHNIVFALYVIGIVAAVATGFFLRNTLLDKSLTPMIMELPTYHLPNTWLLMRQTWQRLKHFLIRAGRVIVPVCTILGAINILGVTQQGLVIGNEGQSILAYLGRLVTPIFAPIGIDASNWPATVGLLMGTLAKEVVIATLNTVYASAAGLQQASNETFVFWQSIQSAFMTIPENLSNLGQAFLNPFMASIPEQSLEPGVGSALAQHFRSATAAFSYLIFVLLYVPCVSTMAALKKELGRFWMYFSIVWSTAIAYMTAAVFYQLATIQQHFVASILYVIGAIVLFWLMKLIVKTYLPSRVQLPQSGVSA